MDIVYLNIKKRREELKMSQRELAAKVGYKDNSTIAKMEKGLVDPTLGRLKQIAKALETTLPALLGYEEEENEVSSTDNNRLPARRQARPEVVPFEHKIRARRRNTAIPKRRRKSK